MLRLTRRLAGALVADIAGEYQNLIEEDWQKYVLVASRFPSKPGLRP